MRRNSFQSLVTLLSNILEAHTTAFFVLDPVKRQLHLAAAQTLSKQLSQNITLPLEQSGILSQACKAGQIIHLDKKDDISFALSSTLPFYREQESHIKGVLVAPVGDETGVIYVDTKYSWGFNTKQQKWILEVADLLHELLEHQDTVRQQRNFSRILSLYAELDQAFFKGTSLEEFCRSIIDQCAAFLETEYAVLVLNDVGQERYRVIAGTSNLPRNVLSQHFSVKDGLIGRIFQKGKPLFIPKLNPDSPEHFLFSSKESLPHSGTLWGLPSALTTGQSLVLAFFSRNHTEWPAEDRHAIAHVLNFVTLMMDKFYLDMECRHLNAYDLTTGLFNRSAFQVKFDDLMNSSVRESSPLCLALLQIEPWQVLYSRFPPKEVQKWQEQLASELYHALPGGALCGQINENRFGFIFPGMTPQETDQQMELLSDRTLTFTSNKVKRIRLRPYFSSAGFPQDGVNPEELWTRAYRRLLAAFQYKS